MLLKSVRVTNYKSIVDSGEVPIDSKITVLVGQNESGKSAFLEALYQARPVFGIDKGFEITTDYPRKNLNKQAEFHNEKPIRVLELVFILEEKDSKSINSTYGVKLIKSGEYTMYQHYNDSITITNLESLIDESVYIQDILKDVEPSDFSSLARSHKSIKKLLTALADKDLPNKLKSVYENLQTRFGKSSWTTVLGLEIYTDHLFKLIPKFFYFDEYRLLPGKANLINLQNRITEANNESEPKPLSAEEQTVLALLQMAGVQLKDLLENKGYEEARANLEGVSNDITDKFLKFWLHNSDLQIIIDIAEDKKDVTPFNNGPNLYVRIRNNKHRVTLPFNQRSKGFIWFFSFLVWFNNVHERVAGHLKGTPIVLLLDEPGLNLHALAQQNLLAYIDSLAEKHQVIYSTHSPFMVHPERLSQVRVVEDKEPNGTSVSSNLDSSDSKTLFPLQAALGYTIAQNLFISKRNLIVEGIADLAYLQFFSQACENAKKEGLRSDITIMPVGGIDKIATFVALLGANKLELVIVHDYSGTPEAKLESLVREKILQERDLLSYAPYRNPTGKKPTKAEQAAFIATDIEDLFSIELYSTLFNEAYTQELKGELLTENNLPPGIRVIDRINRWLLSKKIKVRPSDGFNHYTPVRALVSGNTPIDSETINRFSAMFTDINKSFSKRD